MAAGRLASPGTEFGPCESTCEHVDCNATRTMAESICHFCQKPIGYDKRFYMEPDKTLVHAICFEDAVAEVDGS